MKKSAIFGVICIVFMAFSLGHLSAQEWTVYDGSVLPDAFAPAFVTSSGTFVAEENVIVDDDAISGNKLLRMDVPGKADGPEGQTAFYWRMKFDSYDIDIQHLTVVMRAKGNPDRDMAVDIDMHYYNYRSRVTIHTGTNLARVRNGTGDDVTLPVDVTEWNTYRFTMDTLAMETKLYINEDPTPAMVLAPVKATSSNRHFRFGDGDSGNNFGADIDWVIWDVTGAYAPGEGVQIPPYLKVDGGPPPAKWLVYDAGVLPTETAGAGGDTLDISDVSDDYPGTGMIAEIIDDPDITGNKIFKYLHPDGKRTFCHYFDESYEDSNFTIVTRIKGENDVAYDRAFDIRWDNANAGTRDELRIWPADSTLELEKADVSIKLDVDFYAWHTFRIVVSGDLAEVYLDENPEPVVSGITTATTSSQYLKIGDGSGDAIGGYMDWLILDVSGAYGPDEGLPIPEGLFVDHGPEPYIPKWLVYDAGILPSETADCGGDTLDLSSVSDGSPGTGFVEEIIDDPDISGNKLLKYLQPDAAAKTMYRHYMDEVNAAESITLMARVKGERDAAYDRAFDLQWRNAKANARDELRIWPADSTLELEKAGVEVKVNLDLYEWHTYRIAVYGDSAVVFIDEYKEPYLSGVSSETTSDLYIKIGDGSSDAVGGYLDWCILDISGAFEPGEGLAIPAELYVDEFEFIAQPGWRIYDGSVLPTETGDGGDSLNISSLSDDSPGTDMVEEIVDDPDITGNKLFQYEQPGQYGQKRMYRSYFNEYWKGTDFTLIFRTRALDGYDQNFTFQWRLDNANAREDLRFYPPTGRLYLEKAGVEIFPEFSFLDWHTYRVAVYGDSTAVFVDEDPIPVITGKTSDGTSDHYFKFGDRGAGTVGGLLDWMIMDISGAYAPGEGVPIPEGLYVDVPDAVEDVAVLPKAFKLSQNYPNPFNPTTVIQYEVPRQSKVVIKLYDMLGKEVLTMVNKEQSAGRYSLTLDASRLASGIYFYNMQADNFVKTKKMVLLK